MLLVLIGLIWTVHRNAGRAVGSLASLSFWGFLNRTGGIVKHDVPDVVHNLWLIPARLP